MRVLLMQQKNVFEIITDRLNVWEVDKSFHWN